MGWGKSAHMEYISRIWKFQAGGGKFTVVCRSRKPLNRKGVPCETRSVPHGGAFSFFENNGSAFPGSVSVFLYDPGAGEGTVFFAEDRT